MFCSGNITTVPNPPVEGQSVVITVPHSGPWLISRDGSGEYSEVTADSRGEIDLPAPPGTGGQSFTISDGRDPPTHASFTVQGNS